MPERAPSRLFEVLATPPAELSKGEAEQITLEHFGIAGTATPLLSERDQNFRIVSRTGERFVLKLANPLEPPEVTRFQTDALSHLATHAPSLSVPRVCLTRTGRSEARLDLGPERACTVRLLTYLDGVPLDNLPSSPHLRAELGIFLARLGEALREFTHPGVNYELLWNLAQAEASANLLAYVADTHLRALAARHIENFRTAVRPRLPGLRSQVIYNDLNASNVLVDPAQPDRIHGLIDFGDLTHSPLVVDVAVAATYQLRHTDDPLEAATQLLAGYQSITPLEAGEVDVLFDLITTRLVLALLITTWRATLYPDNRDYILRNTPSNWDMLRHLNTLPRPTVQKRLREACGLPELPA